LTKDYRSSDAVVSSFSYIEERRPSNSTDSNAKLCIRNRYLVEMESKPQPRVSGLIFVKEDNQTGQKQIVGYNEVRKITTLELISKASE
jgi:hypothetical protein